MQISASKSYFSIIFIENKKICIGGAGGASLSKVSLQPTMQSLLLPHRHIKYPVNFDDELKIGDVRYDDMT